MAFVVVTEGEKDKRLLEWLLQEELRAQPGEIRIINAGGWSAADALARSYLAAGDDTVALLVDADSTHPKGVQDRRMFLQSSLGMVGRGDRYRVFLAEPEIERLFFSEDWIIEALAGQPVSREDLIRGEYESKRILDKLLGEQDLREILGRLSDEARAAMREHPPVRDLLAFLEEVRRGTPVAS